MADWDLQPTDLDPFGGGGIDPSALGQAASDAWDWLKAAPGRFTQAQAQDAAAQEAWRQQSGSTDPLGLVGADGSLSPRANQGIGIMGGLAGNGVLELPNAMQDAAMATRLAGAGDRATREALPVDSTPATAQAAAPALEPVDHDPFIVYHGSRHTFEEAPDNPFGAFQDTAIGSGEGAQVYGIGHYVAQNPSIAEFYRDAGTPNGEASGPGNLYKAQFTANPDHLLDWDAPFSQQHPEVQAKLQAAGLHPQSDFYLDGMTPEEEALSVKAGFKLRPPLDPNPPDLTGEDLYSQIGSIQGLKAAVRLDPTRNDVLASKALSNAGIPGIKYLDAGSRNFGNMQQINAQNIADTQNSIEGFQKGISDMSAEIENIKNGEIDQYVTDSGGPEKYIANNQKYISQFQQYLADAQARLTELQKPIPQNHNLVVFNPKHLNIVSRNGEALDLAPVDHDPFNPEDPFYTQGAPQP